MALAELFSSACLSCWRILLIVLRSQMLFPRERVWGMKSNGSFSGFLGMVQKGEIDIMLGPMAPTPGREEAADFTSPYDVNYVSLLTWKPVKYVDPFNFVLSFDLNVWLGIFFSWILLAFVTANLDTISGRLLWHKKRSFAEFIWIYFKLLFPNGYPNNKASRFRLLLGVWLLAMVVIMGLLNCTLTSTMLVRKTTDYVDNFEDLLRFPKVKIATEKSTYFSRLLKDPVGDTFTKLSSRHEEVFSIYRAGPVLDSVIDQVLKQRRVMIGTDVMLKSHIADHFVKTGTCRHHVTNGMGGVMHIVMLVRKTLPKDFKRKLDGFITHINQCDVYHKEMEWRLRNYTMCKNDRDDGIKPLAMVDLQGGFIVLVVGIGISQAVFLAEWTYRMSRARHPRTQRGN